MEAIQSEGGHSPVTYLGDYARSRESVDLGMRGYPVELIGTRNNPIPAEIAARAIQAAHQGGYPMVQLAGFCIQRS